MLGYYGSVDLFELEQQVLQEFDVEEPYDPLWILMGSTLKKPQEPEKAKKFIREGFCCLKGGNLQKGYMNLKQASDLAPRSLLSLVAGDLGKETKHYKAGAECYARVKYRHPHYYSAAVSRKGRLYTTIMSAWRLLGLKPVVVSAWGGEGADVYLMELVFDENVQPCERVSAEKLAKLTGLGQTRFIFLEMWVSSIFGEVLDDGEKTIYGDSPVIGMGPYIKNQQDALHIVKNHMDICFSELKQADPDWRDKIGDAYNQASLFKKLHIHPLYVGDFESNCQQAHDIIYGSKKRYDLFSMSGECWFEQLRSIEPNRNR